ncbi:hypothetical protein VCHA53O466_50130 [Vibrio chagasii]|nr:hypothetical protein VCHA53O466_50130 [Vibrio chagasii]
MELTSINNEHPNRRKIGERTSPYNGSIALDEVYIYYRYMGARDSFCIASIEVADEHQNKGITSSILTYAEHNLRNFKSVEVELVHTPHLYNHLCNRTGWSKIDESNVHNLSFHFINLSRDQ